MNLRNIFCLFATVFMVDGSAIAGDFQYLASDAADFSSVQAPPASGSDAEEEDLAQVLKLQRKRTSAQCSRAQGERTLEFSATFGGAHGPLNRKEIGAGEELYLQIKEETDFFVNTIKMHFKRERPYTVSSKVKPCLPVEASASYPSGHAAIAREAALVFGLVYPGKARALMNRADEIGLDRVIGGVHYPSDIKAGQELAKIVFEKLKANEKFKQAVTDAHWSK